MTVDGVSEEAAGAPAEGGVCAEEIVPAATMHIETDTRMVARNMNSPKSRLY
jgi:hypothetical protein